MEYYSSLDASQLDAETPTLFELISAGQLESLLSPSLRYILVHYASKYPYYLIRLTNNFDELNLALRTFIEWYFFKYWQGSFTENFYGIKRVNQTPLADEKYNSAKLTQLVPSLVETRRELTGFQTAVSIFEITGSAYLSEKLNYMYEIWYAKYATQQLEVNETHTREEATKIRLKRAFVKSFPYIQSAVRAGNFITTLMYLSGSSKSPSLLTYLFKIDYARLNQHDYTKNEPSTHFKTGKDKKISKTAPPTNLEFLLKLVTRNFTRPTWRIVKLILGTFFPVAIFSLKFLEWWNNSDFSSKLAKNQGTSLDFTLPPPSLLYKALGGKKKYKSGKVCPLCKKELTNPAIIETGYVFDYMCIYNYLEKSHIRKNDEDSDDEDLNEKNEKSSIDIDINMGGRCPITGRKLLGCRWNAVKEEWDIDGIRRLIF